MITNFYKIAYKITIMDLNTINFLMNKKFNFNKIFLRKKNLDKKLGRQKS